MARQSRDKLIKVKFFYLVVLLMFIATIVTLTKYSTFPWRSLQRATSLCTENPTQGIVLVIVYNFPFYSSIPILKRLYGKAFSNIVFCGPKDDNRNPLVEYVYHHKGYFGYMCLARAMELYPPHAEDAPITTNPRYHGYLLINDDVMLNFWNFDGFDKTKIWEGPKVPIKYAGHGPKEKWYWWKSRWGMSQCQKAFDEIWSLRERFDLWSEMNATRSLEILGINGNGQRSCYRGRSDIFYVPHRFSEMFDLLAHVFYKHSVFLEIAVPTILRMLDLKKNFEYIPGVYLPGRINDSTVRDNIHFRKIYNKKELFVHPMKLNYEDVDANKAFLESFVIKYINTICYH